MISFNIFRSSLSFHQNAPHLEGAWGLPVQLQCAMNVDALSKRTPNFCWGQASRRFFISNE
jgi:hypothetical protein